VLGATTTYGYDWAGNRVYQQGTSTTSIYPFKWYSVASSTGTGAKYSTTTEYVFNGDTLLATIDQQKSSGTATGTAKTRYVHPDHLGSTNVVTDENANLVQTLDYYPYGGTRISVATSTRERRQFIDQFTDDSTLSYLNARYYASDRGQFMSQDPIFWEVGQTVDGIKALYNPQALNNYGYANDNPIANKDPNGRGPEIFLLPLVAYAPQIMNFLQAASQPLGQVAISDSVDNFSRGNYGWGAFALISAGNPETKGIAAAINRAVAAGYPREQVLALVSKLGPDYARLMAGGGERAAMMGADNPKLANMLNDLYRPGDALPGGTAGAVRYTAMTGQLVGGKGHLEKAQSYLTGLQNLLGQASAGRISLSQSDLSKIGYSLTQLQGAIKEAKATTP
jgi:RHS repeat-associated protein